jgi:hypothetical protein
MTFSTGWWGFATGAVERWRAQRRPRAHGGHLQPRPWVALPGSWWILREPVQILQILGSLIILRRTRSAG